MPSAKPEGKAGILRPRKRDGWTSRPWAILLLGFGGLLAIMAATGANAVSVLGRLREDEHRERQAFLDRSRLLEEIRSQIYLSGTFVRDYLLAPELADAHQQLLSIEALHDKSARALTAYGSTLTPQERPPFESLRAEIDSYWKVLSRTFEWSPEERSRRRYAFFYNELIPRRTSMLQIADRVAAINEAGLRRGNEQLSESFWRVQLGVLITIGITLLGGAAVAALTIVFTMRLEREARGRFDESSRAKVELQELSAKLLRAQEDERRSLSRELHDEVGQSFSAILMETENLLDLEAASDLRAHLSSVRDLAEKGVNEIRNMALLLRPSMLDDFGLVPALNWQAREVAKRTGLRVQVAASDEADELPEEHKTCIYRVVQEALNNCAKHSRARAVQVAVRGEDGKILLSVKDDGSGFDPERTRGLGLLGMEERVKHLGGAFDIDSQPGRGTLITAELPVFGWNGDGQHAYSARG